MLIELLAPLLSLISSVVGTMIGGWLVLQSKRNEYTNAYYKRIIDRRLAAYEEIENLVVQIKISVIDSDGRPYHLLFSKDDDHELFYKLMLQITSRALWLTDDLYAKMRELNVLIFSRVSKEKGLIEFGKLHYRQIAELRTAIERLHARDLLNLHQVAKFLKSKKPEDTYAQINAEA